MWHRKEHAMDTKIRIFDSKISNLSKLILLLQVRQEPRPNNGELNQPNKKPQCESRQFWSWKTPSSTNKINHENRIDSVTHFREVAFGRAEHSQQTRLHEGPDMHIALWASQQHFAIIQRNWSAHPWNFERKNTHFPIFNSKYQTWEEWTSLSKPKCVYTYSLSHFLYFSYVTISYSQCNNKNRIKEMLQHVVLISTKTLSYVIDISVSSIGES